MSQTSLSEEDVKTYLKEVLNEIKDLKQKGKK
jgi:hypothetical protein